MSSKYPSGPRQKVIERVKSMCFLCISCDSKIPLTPSITDYDDRDTGAHVLAFLICRGCKNKFLVKIQDQGKIT